MTELSDTQTIHRLGLAVGGMVLVALALLIIASAIG